MTTDFSSALRNAEGALSIALDNQKMYENLAKRWRNEAEISQRVLNSLREVAGIPRDAPVRHQQGFKSETPPRPTPMPSSLPVMPDRDDNPVPVVRVAKEAAPAAPLTPAAVVAAAEQRRVNGFDRLGIKRQLRDWHVKYPLAKTYKSGHALARQAYRALLTDHVDYRRKWIGNGHIDLNGSVNVTIEVLEHAGRTLGIQYEPVMRRALALQADVAAYGMRGVDYLWEQDV